MAGSGLAPGDLVKLLKFTELNTWNGWILWYQNYTSIKLLEDRGGGKGGGGRKKKRKCTTLVMNYIHNNMQPSPPSIYKTCSSSQTETLYPLSNKSSSSSPSAPGKP